MVWMTNTMLADALKNPSICAPVHWRILQGVIGGVVVDATTTPLTISWVMYP